MLTAIYYRKSLPVQVLPDAVAIQAALNRHDGLLWVDLEHPNEAETAILEGIFHFHPLLVQECLRFAERPKVEFTEDCVYVIMHGPIFKETPGWVGVDTAEVDIFVGDGFFVTYHPHVLGAVTTLRERCKTGAERYMGRGVDFLLYHFSENVVESFFAVIETLEVRIEALEKEMFTHASAPSFRKIVNLKRDLMNLRRILAPQREVFSLLSREETRYISSPAQRYLRAAYDHITIIHDVIDIDRDMVAGLRDTYLSFASNRLAEIMKVLTIITTCIMIPTLIAGAWGMNFDHIPFKDFPHAFAVYFLFSITVVVGMLWFFRKQKWV